MLKRANHVWTCYILTLAVLLPGFGWLSLRAIELDRASQSNQLQSAHEQQVRLGLWRMDSRMMPIITREASLPYFVYEPYYAVDESGTIRPSPLMAQPSEFVRLNFQLTADGNLISPQVPPPEIRDWALTNGGSAETIDLTESALAELASELRFADIFDQLPEDQLPELTAGAWPVDATFDSIATRRPGDAGGPPSDPDGPSIDELLAGIDESAGDLNRRSAALQSFAQQRVLDQRARLPEPVRLKTVQEGVSLPLWVGEHLILARRVTIDSEPLIQGCWLDWDGLQSMLAGEIADTLPEATLVPLAASETADPSRILAAVPVRLDVPDPPVVTGASRSLFNALTIAWAGLILGLVAIAILLYGVTSLSERRAAFVSAVTHELRTPLTTFQLYTEMLADGIVDEKAKRHEYVQTLRAEADRFGHLIDNVLAYSRMEHRPPRKHQETTSLGELLDRALPRLLRRAELASAELTWDLPDELRNTPVNVDPSIVEQILFNLVDNACKYARSENAPEITLSVKQEARTIVISVRDNGPGIGADVRRSLFQPFSKTAERAAESAPGIGLGLALSRGLARDAGGDLRLRQSSPTGCVFELSIPCA